MSIAAVRSVPGLTLLGLLHITLPVSVGTSRPADRVKHFVPDSGTIAIHLLERSIGRERYELGHDGADVVLSTELDFLDRGSHVRLEASLRTGADFTPKRFRALGSTYRFVNVDIDVTVAGDSAHIRNLGDTATVPVPGPFFTVRGYAPLAGRAVLIQYWKRHHRPLRIAALPGVPGADIKVEFRGVDTLQVNSRLVPLQRYSVDGVVWGREAVWLDAQDRFAAVVTRVHILPLEAVRMDLEGALPQLQAIAVRDRMADLKSFTREVAPVAHKTFALIGGRVIDGTGRPAIENATVIIRAGRIAAVGPHDMDSLSAGMPLVDAHGKTLLPGLWDMHGHVSQIEWGPAYLAAGVTTVRDVGGASVFLMAFRDTLNSGRGIGPHLILAGLVDGEAPDAFGVTSAATAEQGIAAVDAFRARGFRQIKLYNSVPPAVVGAITHRAHELGMTVTGHIPTALGLAGAVDSGMDAIEHLPIDEAPTDSAAQQLIALLARKRTVVDPTVAWNELLGRAPTTAIADFEPGILTAPSPIALNYRSVHNDIDAATAAEGLRQDLAIVKALHDAGVPIVAGTDGGVPAYSLLRVLELYVEAGLTPIEAIQTATLLPARAMGMEAEVGTIEVGKRADLLVLDADPLVDITNLRSGHWVIVSGRMYECRALWNVAEFMVQRH